MSQRHGGTSELPLKKTGQRLLLFSPAKAVRKSKITLLEGEADAICTHRKCGVQWLFCVL